MGTERMYGLPADPKRIRQRIRRYERAFVEERARLGTIHDGAGKRYRLGPLYLLMGDLHGALDSYSWFEAEFPHDLGGVFQYLCWTLTLYRLDLREEAANKLIQTMMHNLYVIPFVLGWDPQPLDIWHASNWHEIDYLDYLDPAILGLITDEEKNWMSQQYRSPKATAIRERFIEICRQLEDERPGPKRSQLFEEASRLEHLDLRGLSW